MCVSTRVVSAPRAPLLTSLAPPYTTIVLGALHVAPCCARANGIFPAFDASLHVRVRRLKYQNEEDARTLDAEEAAAEPDAVS